jgi:hypothetical protein
MKFFKPTNRDHPGNQLPTVVWDPENNRAKFEFFKGESGLLEFTTDNPDLILELKAMGYGYEEIVPAEPAVIKKRVMDGDKPAIEKKVVEVGIPKAVPLPKSG